MNQNELSKYFDDLERGKEWETQQWKNSRKRGQMINEALGEESYAPYITDSGEQYSFSPGQLDGTDPYPEELAGQTLTYDTSRKPKKKMSYEEFLERKKSGQISEGNGVYATDPNPRQQAGSFRYNNTDYAWDNGSWTAKKPDGTLMNPGEMWDHTSKKYNTKPGQVTGRRPLSAVSKLFDPDRLSQTSIP